MTIILALFISLLAGLATSIGALLATRRKFLERSYLALALAFAAGAMLFISFVEMLPLGLESLARQYSSQVSQAMVYGAFVAGITLVALIDRLLPKSFNPSEIEGKEDTLSRQEKRDNKRLLRSGLLVAVVLGLHNFPEGMATFFASYEDIAVGLSLAVAIAIHNIPEGIAVAAPVYAATKSRHKAFWWATLSGLAEPFGALVALGLVSLILPVELFGIIFGVVAGMMVFIAIDELLPAARRYQTDKHQVVYGIVGGIVAVALSMLLVQ